jgi:shikimate dehydrogenase
MTDKYAVIGNPIAHSKSPQIHAIFAKQTNQDISYEAILAPLDGFEATIQELIENGFKGANVTVPFKFEAFRLQSQVDFKASVLAAGAVNTLTFSQRGIVKDNTDGCGLINDIKKNLNCSINNKRLLLIGAGGAAEGVFHPLLEETPSLVVIANRNLDKALAMQNKVSSQGGYPKTRVVSRGLDDLENDNFDIVINATSTGLSENPLSIPNSVFKDGCLAYEMMYGRETPFMRQARSSGAKVSDGLGMLVEQAAEAFYIWRGVRPETSQVIANLRNAN